MGGESSTSTIDTATDMLTGTEMNLLRIPGVQLYLIDCDESVRMGSGHFALILMVQAHTPLAALVAQVGDVQWPVGKDGPVLKIANLRYTFALPGLLYGLNIPETTSKDLIQTYESLMRQHCTFEVRPEIAEAAEVRDVKQRKWNPVPDDASEGAQYWSAVAEEVESYSAKLARSIKVGSTMAASNIVERGEWASRGIRSGGEFAKKTLIRSPAAGGRGDADEVSPRMRKRVEQARRMSAVAKLLSRTLLKGAISATGHVANTLETRIDPESPVQAYLASEARKEIAVASIDAFAKVVEAVETAGKSLMTATAAVGTELVQHRYGEQAGQAAQEGVGAVNQMIQTMWTLNKLGLRMLWSATAASTALIATRSIGSRSSTSSDASVHSRLTSPSFSGVSSLSGQLSISPSAPSHQQDDVDPGTPTTPQSEHELETAQLFPNSSSGLTRQHSNTYSTAPTASNMYLNHQPPSTVPPHHPEFAAYYAQAPHPNSPFQQYTRPGAAPQVQPFFPFDFNRPTNR